MKKLVVFDLDGTLAESKSALDAEMAKLLNNLLGIVRVAVISGGDWPQFEEQLLSHLPKNKLLVNLYLLPTCGTKFFQYVGDWKKIYSEDFTTEEKQKIVSSLERAIGAAGFSVERTWGDVIEDRGSQITFSALGQQAPLKEKTKWDLDLMGTTGERERSTRPNSWAECRKRFDIKPKGSCFFLTFLFIGLFRFRLPVEPSLIETPHFDCLEIRRSEDTCDK
ncbi:MAG: hypothetical protein WBQ89_15850 [Candidatus Acidiferrum sp.]